MRLSLLLLATACPAIAHDLITTKLTWSKEISRVFEKRCMGCHQTNGPAPFPLTTYPQARPWAVAIRDETNARSMPPWNAVKGFGEFRNELSLTQQEIQLITDWVNGGAPEGDARFLSGARTPTFTPVKPGTVRVVPLSRNYTFRQTGHLTGIRLRGLLKGDSARLVLQQPNGETLPLLWVRYYLPGAPDTYLFRDPLPVAPGTRIVVAPAPPHHPAGTIHLLLAPPH